MTAGLKAFVLQLAPGWPHAAELGGTGPIGRWFSRFTRIAGVSSAGGLEVASGIADGLMPSGIARLGAASSRSSS